MCLVDERGILKKDSLAEIGLPYIEGVDDRDPSILTFSKDGKTATYGRYPTRAIAHPTFEYCLFAHDNIFASQTKDQWERYDVSENYEATYVVRESGRWGRYEGYKSYPRDLDAGISYEQWRTEAVSWPAEKGSTKETARDNLCFLYEPIVWDVLKTLPDGKVVLFAHEPLDVIGSGNSEPLCPYNPYYYNYISEFYARAFSLGDDYLVKGQWSFSQEDTDPNSYYDNVGEAMTLTQPVALPSYAEWQELVGLMGENDVRTNLTEYGYAAGAAYYPSTSSEYDGRILLRKDAGFVTLRTPAWHYAFQRIAGNLEDFESNGYDGGFRPVIVVDPSAKVESPSPLAVPQFQPYVDDSERHEVTAGLFPQDKVTNRSIIDELNQKYPDNGFTFPFIPRYYEHKGNYYVRNDDENGGRSWYLCLPVTWRYLTFAGESIDNYVSWPSRIDMTMAIPTKILGFYDVKNNYFSVQAHCIACYAGATLTSSINFLGATNQENKARAAIEESYPGFYDVEGVTDFAVTLFRLFGGEGDYPTDVIFGDYVLQTYFPYSEYQRITLPIRPIFWSSPSESVVGTELEY